MCSAYYCKVILSSSIIIKIESGSLGYSMKTDALTLAAVVFVVSLVISGVSGADFFKPEQKPPAALQQGIATR